MIQSGMRTEAILSYYADNLGESSDSHVYGSETLPTPLHICRYDKLVSGGFVLLTAGLSAYANEIGSVREVALLVNGHADEFSDFLIAALRFAISEKLPIDDGFSLQGLSAINPSLAKSSGKEALYFTKLRSLPREVSSLGDAHDNAAILQAVLISPAENEYFLDHGAEALEAKLGEEILTTSNVNRPSVI